jgi:hypothetical protein
MKAVIALCILAVALAAPCGQTNPCASMAAEGANAAGGVGNVKDAVAPVDEWIKNFKKQMGLGENLYTAAHSECRR